MQRRDLMKLSAAALAASSAPLSASDKSQNSSKLHAPVLGPRMNFHQADKVMAELGLDAMVLGQGMNVGQASGIRPVTSRMGLATPALVIVKRSASDRLAIITSAFGYYFLLADRLSSSTIPAYLYTGPGADVDQNPDSVMPPLTFADRGDAPIDTIESTRVEALQKALAEQGTFADTAKALARALKDMGLADARIASDHPAVSADLAKAAPKATVVDAADALRQIRPVKSDSEIVLMRQAAEGNVRAARAALKTIRAGGSYRDLRAAFYSEAALLGQRGVFMVIDRISDELHDSRFADGQALMIDCVSEYQGYHGDYGRTVFLGEPTKSMKQATKVMAEAWSGLRERLKPGQRFSDISAMGQQSLKAAGKRYQIPFGPHTVGLLHSDHLDPTGVNRPMDVTLEPGMVLSVDCPLLETGIGGSAHLEDLMLITDSGAQPLHDIGDPVIVI